MDFLQKHPTPWEFKELVDRRECYAGYEAIVDANGQEVIATLDAERYFSWLRGDVVGLVGWVNTLEEKRMSTSPDLPKPELTHDFGYAHWDLRSERPVSAQCKRGSTQSSKVFLGLDETHIFDPDEARHLAYNLLAAAQWAEKEYGK